MGRRGGRGRNRPKWRGRNGEVEGRGGERVDI